MLVVLVIILSGAIASLLVFPKWTEAALWVLSWCVEMITIPYEYGAHRYGKRGTYYVLHRQHVREVLARA